MILEVGVTDASAECGTFEVKHSNLLYPVFLEGTIISYLRRLV